MHIVSLELHALVRESIHIWRLDLPRRTFAVVSELCMAEVIEEGKQNVRLRSTGCSCTQG